MMKRIIPLPIAPRARAKDAELEAEWSEQLPKRRDGRVADAAFELDEHARTHVHASSIFRSQRGSSETWTSSN